GREGQRGGQRQAGGGLQEAASIQSAWFHDFPLCSVNRRVPVVQRWRRASWRPAAWLVRATSWLRGLHRGILDSAIPQEYWRKPASAGGAAPAGASATGAPGPSAAASSAGSMSRAITTTASWASASRAMRRGTP